MLAKNTNSAKTFKKVALLMLFSTSRYDERLKFNATGISELALNWAFLAKIWVPDTYFVNGMKSYLHKITVPNRFVRISPDGKVSYSQRLTLWATCPMNLRKFPLDSQVIMRFLFRHFSQCLKISKIVPFLRKISNC